MRAEMFSAGYLRAFLLSRFVLSSCCAAGREAHARPGKMAPPCPVNARLKEAVALILLLQMRVHTTAADTSIAGSVCGGEPCRSHLQHAALLLRARNAARRDTRSEKAPRSRGHHRKHTLLRRRHPVGPFGLSVCTRHDKARGLNV